MVIIISKIVRTSLWALLALFTYSLCQLHGFDKVVIWGHKLHTHTHSYIHNGFYIAFNHLGYQTYWFDDNDDVGGFDFSNTLFLTEGQVDKNIPLRNDCKYLLHNPSSTKYQQLDRQNCIYFQVYTDSILSLPKLVKVEPCIYYDLEAQCLYMPWATDLLPQEIDEIKKNLSLPSKNAVYWIGTVGEGIFGNVNQLAPFVKACTENGIEFIHKTSVSIEDNIHFIQSSYMTPTIVGEWQNKNGYIPCRIFKNISYGKIGITNSLRVYELFEGKIVYNSNTYQLFYDAQKHMETFTFNDLYEQMDFVKNKHTYIHRIHTLLEFLELVNSTTS